MAAPLSTTYRPWIDESDCGLDDFRAQVLRDTDLADYPLASDVRGNVLVYSAAAMPAADSAGAAVRIDSRAGRRARRRGHRRRVLARRRRPCQRGILRHHRRAARCGFGRRRPFRQARRQRPDLERRAEAGAAHAGGVRRVLLQRRARRRLPGLAWPALPGHLPGQRRQSRWYAAGSAPRLSPRLRARRTPRAVSGAPAPHLAGADAAGRGGSLRHAGGKRPDHAAAVFAAVRRRLHRVQSARSSSTSSPSIMCSCRCARATPCSSTRRCITVRDRTSRPISAGSRTCCRSRRRSAGRWRRWTAPRWCERSIRPCAR